MNSFQSFVFAPFLLPVTKLFVLALQFLVLVSAFFEKSLPGFIRERERFSEVNFQNIREFCEIWSENWKVSLGTVVQSSRQRRVVARALRRGLIPTPSIFLVIFSALLNRQATIGRLADATKKSILALLLKPA